MSEPVQRNLLIISDLHLGEDLRPDVAPQEHVDRVEHELVDFLEYYAAHRLDDRPWQLVINGDMVDFISVCLSPAATGSLLGLTDDDHRFGMGTHPRAGRAKLRQVAIRHRGFFTALAGFLAAGNTLEIVVGNHDAELYWPEVQQTFLDALREVGPADLGDPADAVRFHPWFFFVDGLVYVEHGHQYDPYCSFDAILHPVAPSGDGLDWNISSAGLRYFSNHYHPHSPGEEFSFWQYAAWGVRQGAGRILEVFGTFLFMNWRLVSLWMERTEERVEKIKRTHQARLRRLAEHTTLPHEVLEKIDALRERPMALELRRIAEAFMLDRLGVTVAGVGLLALAVVFLPWAWMPLAIALVIGGMLWAEHRFALHRTPIQPQQSMRRAADAIGKLVKAPIVVFGHAHEAASEKLEGALYVNTGTWVAEQKEQVAEVFTHLRIRITEDGPDAQLCQWRKGRSLAYEPVRTG